MLGGAEILVVLVLALLLFGPDKLPELARQVGRGMRQIRRATTEVHRQFNIFTDEEPETRPASTRTQPAASEDSEDEDVNHEDWKDWRYHEDESPAQDPQESLQEPSSDAELSTARTDAMLHEIDLDQTHNETHRQSNSRDEEALASPVNVVARKREPFLQPGAPVKHTLGETHDEPT
jgi:TatA/E family protein of Tat protein translocase